MSTQKSLQRMPLKWLCPAPLGWCFGPFVAQTGASGSLFVTVGLREALYQIFFRADFHPLVYCILARLFCGTLESVLVSLLNAVTTYALQNLIHNAA